MGQGQAEVAMQLLHECAANGEWLCLKNLHLVTAWLPTLEKVSHQYLLNCVADDTVISNSVNNVTVCGSMAVVTVRMSDRVSRVYHLTQYVITLHT